MRLSREGLSPTLAHSHEVQVTVPGRPPSASEAVPGVGFEGWRQRSLQMAEPACRQSLLWRADGSCWSRSASSGM